MGYNDKKEGLKKCKDHKVRLKPGHRCELKLSRDFMSLDQGYSELCRVHKLCGFGGPVVL